MAFIKFLSESFVMIEGKEKLILYVMHMRSSRKLATININ